MAGNPTTMALRNRSGAGDDSWVGTLLGTAGNDNAPWPSMRADTGFHELRVLDGGSKGRAGFVMASEEPRAKKKLPIVKLGILAVVLIAGAVALLRGMDYKALEEQGLRVIRSAGPVAFFAGI